ncbi:MAG: chromosome segregation protein SMC [bacterium]
MYLKRLEIQGFKSFFEKNKLDFENNITAVVGPNGSGKSNISDAIRWVLGEQSAKNLRGDKMEDIIFAGTSNRKPLGFAEVSIILDNQKNNENNINLNLNIDNINLDYSEIKITRKVFRSGETGFFINNTSCRLRDIHELFMDTGLGREGYSIIGQGKIDAILSSKTDDRRAIFEEASGIVKFKTRRTQTENRLEEVRKNLIRTNDIIKEVENQLEPLLEQKIKAEKFLDISGELKIVRVNLFKSDYDQSQSQMLEIEKQIQDTEESIKQEELQKESFIKKQSNLKALFTQKENLIKKTEDSFHNSNIKIEQYQNSINLNTQSIEFTEKEIVRLSQDLEEQTKAILKNQDDINLINSYIQAKRLEQGFKQNDLDVLLKEFDGFNKSLSEQESKIKDINSKIVEYIELSGNLSNSISIFNTNKQQIQEKNKSSINQMNSYKSKNKDLTIRGLALNKNLEDLTQKEDLNSSDIKSLLQDLENLKSKINENKTELDNNSKIYFDLINRYKILSELEKDYEGYYNSVKAILKQKEKNKTKNKNKFDGICGVVGEIISVEKDYEVGIEIALGNAIQNIITHTEEDAKIAIEYLKKNKQGRATFLPISSIRENSISSKILEDILKEEGVLGVAETLIKFDDLYKDIISSLLGRTIVVNNIDNAILFSKKYKYKYKIVTLDGQIVNTGGALTGGSVHKKSGAIFSRGRELQEILSNKELIEQDIKDLEIKSEDLNKNINDINVELNGLNSVQQDILIEKANINNKIGDNNSVIQDVEANILSTQKEIETFKKELEGSFSEEIIKELNNNLDETQEEIKKLKASILSQESNIKENQLTREEQFNNINNLKLEIKDIINLLDNYIKDKDRLQDDIKAKSNNNVLLTESIAHQEERNVEFKNKIVEFENKIELLNKNYLKLQGEYNGFKKEKDVLFKSIEDNNNNILNSTTQIADIKNIKVKLENKIENIETSLDSLINKMWEEYEITYASACNEYKDLELEHSKLKSKESGLKKEIFKLGNINVTSIEEYKILKERYELNTSQRDDIIKADKDLKDIIGTLTKEMENKFREHFEIINENFKKVFSDIFGGGSAYLKLTEPEDVLNSGIEISAKPAGKSLQNLSLLSGGERALTAISLLFAILKLKPSPFCVLDEIEAALDDANVIRFANYLKSFCDDNQFILITHKTGTMEIADVLYGITMEEQGISKVISVELKEAKEYEN